MESGHLLEVKDLCVDYLAGNGTVRAVNHVDLHIDKGETLGLAGESGCGKSTLAFSIAKLHKPPALISSGEILFNDEDVLSFTEQRLQQFRWNEASVVFQSAMNCLNPVITIGEQISDVILAHKPVSRVEAQERAADLLHTVGIHRDRLHDYPHQFSGGMRQRVVIAITLALNPQLIIMDEPTTALDVVVEREIMAELAQLKQEFGFSILLISHDLSLMGEIADRIAVMYAGKLVEVSSAENILQRPQHPYSQGLINSFPLLLGEKKQLTGIQGNPLNLYQPPTGCYFAERCPECSDTCRTTDPELIEIEPGHQVKCHLYGDDVSTLTNSAGQADHAP